MTWIITTFIILLDIAYLYFFDKSQLTEKVNHFLSIFGFGLAGISVSNVDVFLNITNNIIKTLTSIGGLGLVIYGLIKAHREYLTSKKIKK